jgi:hypothetical protein
MPTTVLSYSQVASSAANSPRGRAAIFAVLHHLAAYVAIP